jgi:ribose transport system ATP-binding protein
MTVNDDFFLTKGIRKQFNRVEVLKGVDLSVRRGEVHALMGENGAGKSTMIKIITGFYTKDAGEIYIEGKRADIRTRRDARNCGISVIYQELSLIPALTVTENIFLGQELKRFGLTRRKEMRRRVRELIDKYEFDIDPDAVVERLGMAKRQMVEILKALISDAKLIIMDEPTSSLSASESEKLFETIENLRSKGASILYISHRLDEVYKISDRLTVMRDGMIVGVLDKQDIVAPTVTRLMIGHEIIRDETRRDVKRNDAHCLKAEDLRYKNLLKDINFEAHGGEILGIGGLIGSGRTELIRCIYGKERQRAGRITLNGKPVGKSIAANIRLGFGYVPEDRRREGFIPLLPVMKNIALASYDRLARFGFVDTASERAFAEDAIRDYDIRPAIKRLPTINLSGGNQQKVVLGKWLSRSPQVLLLDEPTAGVDVGVKEDLYGYMRALADTGAIIIMVSSDFAELRHISDRILVLHDGRFFEEFDGGVSQNAILLAASGILSEEGRALR